MSTMNIANLFRFRAGHTSSLEALHSIPIESQSSKIYPSMHVLEKPISYVVRKCLKVSEQEKYTFAKTFVPRELLAELAYEIGQLGVLEIYQSFHSAKIYLQGLGITQPKIYTSENVRGDFLEFLQLWSDMYQHDADWFREQYMCEFKPHEECGDKTCRICRNNRERQLHKELSFLDRYGAGPNAISQIDSRHSMRAHDFSHLEQRVLGASFPSTDTKLYL